MSRVPLRCAKQGVVQKLSRPIQSRSCPSRPYSAGAASSSRTNWSPNPGKRRAVVPLGIVGGILSTLVFISWSRQTLKSDSEAAVKANEALAIHKLPGERLIGESELVAHSTRNDLWVAIDGDVWDLTEFVESHPGGMKILIDHGGMDVTKLFKGIHPPGTLETHLDPDWKVGRLDEEAVAKFKGLDDNEGARIARARSALFGVNSVVALDDFETYAKDLLPAAAWEYYSSGAESETAMKENRSAFDRVYFRPRVMNDVSEVDLRTQVLGVNSSLPIYISPTAQNGLGQPLGEVAVTLGAGKQDILQVLSYASSRSLEEVLAAAKEDQKIGWQLYMKQERDVAAKDIRKAYELGAQSIWLTVDSTVLGRRIRQERAAVAMKPSPNGEPLSREERQIISPNLTWKDIDWIKSLAPGLPVVVKGVGAWEDVVLAKQHGADAVVLSNHGGRQMDFADPSLKTLLDLYQNSPDTLSKSDNFQVFLDGGVRRGTDVLKALCLGASAVGLGRPFIYAATGWGPDGVEKAITREHLTDAPSQEEMQISMRLLGVTTLDQLGPELLNTSKL